MSVRGMLAVAFAAAAVAASGAAWAEPPDASGGDAPVGLERLKKGPSPSGPLPGGTDETPSGSSGTRQPEGTKALGHGQEDSAPGYTPGAPRGDESARPDSIGGGTRVKSRAGSALDDIH
jgi:hypothetical protein